MVDDYKAVAGCCHIDNDVKKKEKEKASRLLWVVMFEDWSEMLNPPNYIASPRPVGYVRYPSPPSRAPYREHQGF